MRDLAPYRLLLRAVALLALVCASGAASRSADTLQTKRRLPGAVNEYAPVVYPLLSFDGRTLYFSRKYHPENVGKTRDADDVWSCSRDSAGTWSEAMDVTRFNSPVSDVLCSISPDGTTALLARTTAENDAPSVRLFVMNHTDSGWSGPKPVTIDGFTGRTSHIYAHLSFDNATLFLAVDIPDRGMDIFSCSRVDSLPDAWVFNRPVSLGDMINTKGTEGSPFLAFDGRTLYFTSDGHRGYGSQDVFVTRRLDSTFTSWSAPENLGDGINTGLIDHCFSLFADGTTALIVSADSSRSAGVFEVTLPPNLRMGPSIVGSGSARPTTDTVVVTVTFPTNKTRIRETNIDSLVLAKVRRLRGTSVRVVISGHTDMTGIEARNSSLSMRRALVLRKTLQAVFRKRAPGLRVTAMQCAGKGVSEPIGDNATEAGRQANRRATARIIIGATPSKTNGDTDRGGRPRRRRR